MSAWEPLIISVGLVLDIFGAIIILITDSEIAERRFSKHSNLFAYFTNWPLIGKHSTVLANLEDIDIGINKLLDEDPMNQNRDTIYFHKLSKGEPGFGAIELILTRELGEVPEFDVISLEESNEISVARNDVRTRTKVSLGIHDTDMPSDLGVEIPPYLLREWVEKHKRYSVIAVGGILLVLGFALQLIPLALNLILTTFRAFG